MNGAADKTVLGCARFVVDEANNGIDIVAQLAAVAALHDKGDEAELYGAIVSVLRHLYWVREAGSDIVAMAEEAERKAGS